MSTYNSNSSAWINLRSSKTHLAHDLLEKPAMYSLCSNVANKSVLCLGCGSGEECVKLIEMGASRVVGIDNSSSLIEYAKYAYQDMVDSKSLEFVEMSIEDIDFEDESFDFVFCSLALHYVEDWASVFGKINKLLKPNSKAIFSVHHPIKWGSKTTRSKESNSFLMGYTKSKTNKNDYQIYGDYLTSRAIDDKLFDKIPITFYHKSISTILKEAREGGLDLINLIEPMPVPISQSSNPDFYNTYSKIPLFLILELEKN